MQPAKAFPSLSTVASSFVVAELTYGTSVFPRNVTFSSEVQLQKILLVSAFTLEGTTNDVSDLHPSNMFVPEIVKSSENSNDLIFARPVKQNPPRYLTFSASNTYDFGAFPLVYAFSTARQSISACTQRAVSDDGNSMLLSDPAPKNGAASFVIPFPITSVSIFE